MDGQVPGPDEVGRDLRAEGRVGVSASGLVERLGAEVVEERDPVVVADVEEEVDEVGVVLRPPADGADRVDDREAEYVPVEMNSPGRVEGGERGVVDTFHPMVQPGHI